MATQIELTRIARNADFAQRVLYLMTKAALAKAAETEPSAGDVLLVQRVLDGAEPVGSWCMAVVANPSIAAGAHAEDGSTIVDSDVEFAVNSVWAAFAV